MPYDSMPMTFYRRTMPWVRAMPAQSSVPWLPCRRESDYTDKPFKEKSRSEESVLYPGDKDTYMSQHVSINS